MWNIYYFSFLASCPAQSSVEGHPANSMCLSVNPELLPIRIEPRAGLIEAGKTLTFNVSFSPVVVAQFQGRLVCRYKMSLCNLFWDC